MTKTMHLISLYQIRQMEHQREERQDRFNGEYEFVFMRAKGNERKKVRIKVKISPEFTKQ